MKDYDKEHELLRRKLWSDIYKELCKNKNMPKVYIKDGADKALKDFDKTFK